MFSTDVVWPGCWRQKKALILFLSFCFYIHDVVMNECVVCKFSPDYPAEGLEPLKLNNV